MPINPVDTGDIASTVSLDQTGTNNTVKIDQTTPNNRVETVVDFATTVDTYTIPATGTIVSNTVPHRGFAVQVKGTSAPATAWNIVVEGSIDGINYTTILTHTEALGENILWSGANLYAVLKYRSRLVSVTLTPATNIKVTILGTT